MKQRSPILSLKSPVQRNIVCLLEEEGEGITERFQQEFFFSNNPTLLLSNSLSYG